MRITKDKNNDFVTSQDAYTVASEFSKNELFDEYDMSTFC